MATVNYTCPNCAAPLKFNPDKQMFSCEYCMSDFTEKYVQDFFAKKEQKENSAEKQEKKEQEKAKENAAKQAQSNDSAQAENKTEEEAVIYNCPSCGAQVVTTASTAATTCFYCQNPVVLGGRLSGEFKPDRVIPFKLSKQKAIDKFLEMCKRKWFLPKNFVSEKHFDKLTGVYFPYWYVDEQRSAQMVAKGEKVRSWTVGDDRYTETKVFELHRAGNLIVNNVFERALKGQDRDMLQCVHPYDLGEAHPFAMSYLSGFQAEKRDIEQNEVAQGEKVRSWTVGDDRYTETKVFELHRAGNLIVNNVFERALKGQDRDMLQCVHPYDLGEAHPFAMSYLSGFQAEKRDIEQNEVAQAVQTRINGYCQQLMKDTASGYSAVQIQNYNDKIDLENWNYTLLPVWVVTYKYRGKILPFAVNGQTGKTYGELPTSAGKLLAFAAIIAAALMALGLLGGLLFL